MSDLKMLCLLMGVVLYAVTTEAIYCETSSDCAQDECCVLPLVGRRKLLSVVIKKSGMLNYCGKMPQIGEYCIARDSLVPGTRPEEAGFACPCPAETTCVPDGGYEVPQGPTGKCEKDKASRKLPNDVVP